MVVFAIHTTIYISQDRMSYQYIKHNYFMPGDSSTLYDLVEEDISNYLKRGYKIIRINGKNILYEIVIRLI